MLRWLFRENRRGVFVESGDGVSLGPDAIGKAVVLYDDERLGAVADVVTAANGRRYLVVTSSLFGTGRYYVPESEIRRIGPERILLNTTRDDLRELDWLSAPRGVE
jgi:hypothetical protein